MRCHRHLYCKHLIQELQLNLYLHQYQPNMLHLMFSIVQTNLNKKLLYRKQSFRLVKCMNEEFIL